MPRAFTESEKWAIQERLLEVGRERFARYGIRKTNVEELTREAGISKGAFYLFYSSKEELYFDVMSQVESEIQTELLEVVRRTGEPSKESFRQFLSKALAILEAHPFFANTEDDDYQYLLRTMPPERLQEGIEKDEAFAAGLLSAWAEKGVHIVYEPKIVSAVLRSLVFISAHRSEFEPDVYSRTMELMTHGLAEQMVQSIGNAEGQSSRKHNG